MAQPDASVVILNGWLKLGFCNTGSEQRSDRSVSKARCWSGPQLNLASLRKGEANGFDIWENLLMNLR